MLKSRRLRDIATAGLFVLFIFAATLCAQSPANNELLKMIPAKTLFCVRVNNFDYTLNQIDQIKANSPKQIGTEMKAALSLLPEASKTDFVVTFNALRLFNLATSMIPIPIPPMDVQTKSNIVIAGRAADSKMVVNIAVPKQHLIEIVSAFMMMQQKTAQ